MPSQLFNRIVDRGPFPEAEAAKLFAQILLSMEYLHSLDIVHRDVKPENILYTAEGSDSVKLIDFGYAGVWSAEKELTGLCGTPDYVAPEVLTWYEEDVDGTPYGKASDLWSLGVLLYVILSGCSPFSADEEDEILKLVAQAQYVFHESEFAHVSASAKDMIAKLLVADPSQRLTMAQLLSHPWLADAVATGRAEIAAAKAAKANGAKPAAAAAKPAAKPQQQQPSTRTAGEGDAGKVPTAAIEPRVDKVGSKSSTRASRPGGCAPPPYPGRLPSSTLISFLAHTHRFVFLARRAHRWVLHDLVMPRTVDAASCATEHGEMRLLAAATAQEMRRGAAKLQGAAAQSAHCQLSERGL